MLLWAGKEPGAFHTALLAPQTPRGIKCPLVTAGTRLSQAAPQPPVTGWGVMGTPAVPLQLCQGCLATGSAHSVPSEGDGCHSIPGAIWVSPELTERGCRARGVLWKVGRCLWWSSRNVVAQEERDISSVSVQ